ncbi:DNA-directed DNA polymerase alpha subunit pol12 [Malassezia sp. CBS 17886]|nr:DNA-directed DNA polymerase alpha subunit pol12 [Malassezia sp. CBS 17886]
MANLADLLGVVSGAQAPSAQRESFDVDTRSWDTSLAVTDAHNAHGPSAWDETYLEKMPPRSAPRVALAVGTDPKLWNYRYMFDKKGARSHGMCLPSRPLDERLDEMGDAIRAAFEIDAEYGDPSVWSQESMYTVGRICARIQPPAPGVGEGAGAEDGAHGATRLTAGGLVLETSRVVGNGQRVPLVLDPSCRVRYAGLSEGAQVASLVGLFPGMIVGVRGRNGGGNRFVAEEILVPSPLPHPSSTRMELAQHQYDEARLAGGDLRLLAASGPFTDAGDLEFRPWHAFMSYVERMQPDVLVLTGPFLSERHPLVAACELDVMPAAIFQRHIAHRLQQLLERSPCTRPILVPSTDDVFHKHHAFPQPFIDKTDAALALPKKVYCLPNPSIIYVNELAIGVSTADVLGDLRREEVVQRVQSAGAGAAADARDPIVRLVRHVLCQRSFYPVFPPPPSSTVPLDLSHSQLCALDNVTPDIMLLPTARAKPFVRLVDSALAVNPGPLAGDDASGGRTAPSAAFLRVQVRAMPRASVFQGAEREGDMVEHDAAARARVELVQTP